MNEKGGKIDAETVTQDMIDSSTSMLQTYRGRGLKGLQQFFSPQEAANLVGVIFGDVVTLDMTAGNGALLSALPPACRFGIEIDPDHTKNAPYTVITGDLQKVYPLMRKLNMLFDAIAINPPFGLMWEDESFGGKINSTELCYLYATKLLSPYGQGVLIAGRDRLLTDILPREEGKLIYAILEVKDMFENADIPTVMAFFTNRPLVSRSPWHGSCTRSELVHHGQSIIAKRNMQTPYVANYTNVEERQEIIDNFAAIQDEYTKRYAPADGKQRHYSISVDKRIRVKLSPYQKVLLARTGERSIIESLHNQSANYFALNPKTFNQLLKLEEGKKITISERTKATVRDILTTAEKYICPMYPVKPQQRLGFLSDLENITCVKDDPKNLFRAGSGYPLSVQTIITREEYKESKINKEGELIEQNKAKERKLLQISIGDHIFNETTQDIAHILNHFELPDPQDIATRYPEEFTRHKQLLTTIANDYGFTLKEFQTEDIARLLFKQSGLLAWEQGLGKTLAGLVFAEACIRLGAEDKALIIVPQDLIPQWQREVEHFFGEKRNIDGIIGKTPRKLEVIRTIADARRVEKHLKKGGTGWYITYYEAISRNGREFELLPHKLVKRPHPKAGEEYYDWREQAYKKYPRLHDVDTQEFCPNCNEPAQHGKWHPKRGICEDCGYSHIKSKVKPAYSRLGKVFQQGIIIIDEGTKIKGNDTLMSKAVRGLKARHKLLLTGTPIKNYIPDAFWLLWWALGNNSYRFPFAYEGGADKFSKEFAVIEYTYDKFGNKIGSPKVLPEVSNLSILWRLLCSSIVRRRKEETGENLVERTFKPITCPFGTQQREMYEKWLDGFKDYFIKTHPTAPISKYPDLVERSAAILGQLWKLEFSSILPQAEPTDYYSKSPNWTPANLKVLELAYQHAKQGDKVLIGSDLMAYGQWTANQLNQKWGVNAVHIIDESKSTGKIQTKSPEKRAGIVNDFRNNGTNVLCASLQSMNLGHNLDTANVVIVHGLPWDYATFDQFIARVHRLTSKRDVTIYIVLTEGSIDERKWQLLNNKSAAAQLALDGHLFEQHEEQIDLQKVLDDLKAKGIPTGTTINEADITRQWQKYNIIPPIEGVVPNASHPKATIPATSVPPLVEGVIENASHPEEIATPKGESDIASEVTFLVSNEAGLIIPPPPLQKGLITSSAVEGIIDNASHPTETEPEPPTTLLPPLGGVEGGLKITAPTNAVDSTPLSPPTPPTKTTEAPKPSITEQNQEILRQWQQMASLPPKRKKVKIAEGQMTLFNL
jgi:SNF2 family DNA or RNA helicase